jgi:DNA-directed RNA polymerase sigma subunit (sigma70/sigma32)
MNIKFDKDAAREKVIREYPNAPFLRLNKNERQQIEAANRRKEDIERRLKMKSYIVKLREVDKKSLRKIGKEVGLSYERVRQILKS